MEYTTDEIKSIEEFYSRYKFKYFVRPEDITGIPGVNRLISVSGRYLHYEFIPLHNLDRCIHTDMYCNSAIFFDDYEKAIHFIEDRIGKL